MPMIKLAKNLDMPLSAVTQKFAFLGRTGSGKTYGSGKLAEEMLLHGAQIIALDVVGNWYALRIPKDTRNKPFDVHIFGGQHGDIEINPKAGKIVAGIIIEKNLSAVVDISEFISSEQTRFAYDFLTELFERRKAQPAACHVFIEEAQELVPQNLPPSQKGGDNFAARMLHAGERLLKIGRNYGIGATIITQRPQDVNKKVLNQTEVLLAFQMTGLQERKTIADWIREKGQDENLADKLPKLETGHALVWSPAWLKISGTFKIGEKMTADVSATPEVGVDAPETQPLEPRDVSELSESIKALTAEMEANTPAALKKRIADLEKQMKAAPAAAPVPANDIGEIEVFPAEKYQHVVALIENTRTWADNIAPTVIGILENWLTAHLGNLDIEIRERSKTLVAELDRLKSALPPASTPLSGQPLKNPPRIAQNLKIPAKTAQNLKQHPVSSAGTSANGNGYRDRLNPKQRKMLDTLLTFEALGRDSVQRELVAAFAEMSSTGGSFGTYLSALKNGRSDEFPPLIEIASNNVRLTDAGRAAAESSTEINSVEDLHEAWKRQVKGPKPRRMLEFVIENHPDAVTREELAAAVDMEASGGSFGTYLSGLKGLGIIEYCDIFRPGKQKERGVQATDLLFPEGLL